MFYSNTIFKEGTDLDSNTITTLVGSVNFVSAIVGMFLLTIWGRRTIMLWCNFICAILLILTGYFSLTDHPTLVVVLIMIFITVFEFGPGPITWLYNAEILQDKANSIATVVNWVMTLVVSACIPGVIDSIGVGNIGYIFIFVGILTTCGFLFMFVFMLETKGKTTQQIEDMFYGVSVPQKKNKDDNLIIQSNKLNESESTPNSNTTF